MQYVCFFHLKIHFLFFSSLYTCVANGSTDEFVKAEALQQAKAVQNMLQIGFHLSAQVYEINSVTNITKITTQYYHVSIIFDRKKITSCHCTCNNSSSWCSHIVAVCLCRIAQVRFFVIRKKKYRVFFSHKIVVFEHLFPNHYLDLKLINCGKKKIDFNSFYFVFFLLQQICPISYLGNSSTSMSIEFLFEKKTSSLFLVLTESSKFIR